MTINEYDNENRILLYHEQNWTDDKWSDVGKCIYEYDSSGNIKSWLQEDWTWSTGNEYYQSRKSYQYDSNRNIIYELCEESYDETLKNDNQITYSYDEKSNILSKVKEYWSNDSLWKKWERYRPKAPIGISSS